MHSEEVFFALTFFPKPESFAKIRRGKAEGTFLLRSPRKNGPPFLHREAAARRKLLGNVANAKSFRHFLEDREVPFILDDTLHLNLGRLAQIGNLLNHKWAALRHRVQWDFVIEPV